MSSGISSSATFPDFSPEAASSSGVLQPFLLRITYVSIGGKRSGTGSVLRRGDRRPRWGDRRDRPAQPLLRRALADRPPLLARRPLPAAQLGLRRRRPGRRLRGGGDGALRVRRRIRGRRARVGLG